MNDTAKAALLRAALVGLIGADIGNELDEIESTLLTAVSDNDPDKALLLNAISAIKTTAEVPL